MSDNKPSTLSTADSGWKKVQGLEPLNKCKLQTEKDAK